MRSAPEVKRTIAPELVGRGRLVESHDGPRYSTRIVAVGAEGRHVLWVLTDDLVLAAELGQWVRRGGSPVLLVDTSSDGGGLYALAASHENLQAARDRVDMLARVTAVQLDLLSACEGEVSP